MNKQTIYWASVSSRGKLQKLQAQFCASFQQKYVVNFKVGDDEWTRNIKYLMPHQTLMLDRILDLMDEEVKKK